MIKDAGKLYSPHGLDAAKSGYSNKQNLYSLQWQILISIFCIVFTAWKVSKYGVIYGVNLRLFGLNTEIYGMPIRDDEYAMITSNFWYLFFCVWLGDGATFQAYTLVELNVMCVVNWLCQHLIILRIWFFRDNELARKLGFMCICFVVLVLFFYFLFLLTVFRRMFVVFVVLSSMELADIQCCHIRSS